MNSNLQLFHSRDKPFFQQASQSKVWTNPGSNKSRNLTRSNLLDYSKEISRKSVEKSTVYNPTASKLNHTSSQIDLEILHEIPYKDNITSRFPPLKLQKVITSLEETKTPRIPSQRPKKPISDTSHISGYLEYLNSNTSNNAESFRNKMLSQLDKSQPDPPAPKNPAKAWIDTILPLELRNMSSMIFKNKKRGTLVLSEASSLDLNSQKFDTKMSLLNELQFLPQPEKLVKVPSTTTEKAKTSLENYSETLKAQKLADEIVNHYRLYQENTIKNRDLQAQMNSFLQHVGVAEIFLGKIYRHLPLAMRIYRHMIDPDETKGIMKSPSIDKLSSIKSRQMPGFRPKLIQSRYNIYVRVHEKIQDLNIEFKLQGVQNLENKLLQAHEDLKDREFTALKHVSRIDKKRLNEMKVKFKELDQYDLLAKETENSFKSEIDEWDDETSKFKKELRVVNGRLDVALKRVKTSLSKEFDNYGA